MYLYKTKTSAVGISIHCLLVIPKPLKRAQHRAIDPVSHIVLIHFIIK